MDPKKKSVAITMMILLVGVTSAGCLGNTPSLPGFNIGEKLFGDDWILQSLPITLETEVRETAVREDSDSNDFQINRTAVARVSLYSNAQAEPVLEGLTDNDTSLRSKLALPVEQASKFFGPGSDQAFSDYFSSDGDKRGGNLDEPTWDDVIAEPYSDGEDIYLERSGRGDGLDDLGDNLQEQTKRTIQNVENWKNKGIARIGFWVSPVLRYNVRITNGDDGSVVYESGTNTVSLPGVHIDFDPDLEIGQTFTDTYEHEFNLKVLTPFGFIGNYRYDILIQGIDHFSNYTQITTQQLEEDVVGWGFAIGGITTVVIAVTAATIFVASGGTLTPLAIAVATTATAGGTIAATWGMHRLLHPVYEDDAVAPGQKWSQYIVERNDVHTPITGVSSSA